MSKTEKENLGFKEGIYSNLEILPNISKATEKFNIMIEALKNGKEIVFPVGYAKNSIYLTSKRIKDKTGLTVSYGTIQKNKDSPKQFVIYILQIE